ncbi:hypothetical protein ACIOHE_39180 [Streptomyces sp. NPDC087851]|uniref:hypothetical protein n=1 Tax=Streptomyces sp. NPDC087851 TaxID=3365810 RepID=UPI0037F92626
MPSTLGRDGRPLVTTAQAAYSLGMNPAAYREWARRRGITSTGGRRPSGGPGPGQALWDLADVQDAVRRAQPAA